MSLLDERPAFRFDGDPFGSRLQVVSRGTLCDRLASYFRERPSVWIDGRELATVAGSYAWRTRISELRRAPYLMAVENRQRRVGAAKVSEYRWTP